MFDINDYLKKLTDQCREAFGGRLLYIGLQGSYLRGEASEKSDIDVMAVIDRLNTADMDRYREILKKTGYFEKSCGFICGREELSRWNPMEVCQLKFTTKDIFGTLEELLPSAAREDEINYVKISLGNIYHELCHRYIHGDRIRLAERLSGVSKEMFFIIQNLHYLESGDFLLTKSELKNHITDSDAAMLEIGNKADFDETFSAVFEWCQNAFARLESLT